MSSHTYLSFPDDFLDQLIAQRTDFVPFPHRVTHKAQEVTGRKLHQTETETTTAVTANTTTAEQ